MNLALAQDCTSLGVLFGILEHLPRSNCWFNGNSRFFQDSQKYKFLKWNRILGFLIFDIRILDFDIWILDFWIFENFLRIFVMISLIISKMNEWKLNEQVGRKKKVTTDCKSTNLVKLSRHRHATNEGYLLIIHS